MRRGFVAVMLSLAGCAAGEGDGAAPLTAIYSPPVRPRGTGQMMFLPAGKPLALPIEALPHRSAFVGGEGVFRGEAVLADAAACRARLTAIAARAARRYPTATGITILREDEDVLTILGPWTQPMRLLAFRCTGERMTRADGMAMPDIQIPPPPLPPIKTAPVPR